MAAVFGGAVGARVFRHTQPPHAQICAAELETVRAQDEHITQLRQLHTQLTQRVLRCETAPPDCTESIARALAEQARLRCAICARGSK
jgi:hypothetical protein